MLITSLHSAERLRESEAACEDAEGKARNLIVELQEKVLVLEATKDELSEALAKASCHESAMARYHASVNVQVAEAESSLAAAQASLKEKDGEFFAALHVIPSSILLVKPCNCFFRSKHPVIRGTAAGKQTGSRWRSSAGAGCFASTSVVASRYVGGTSDVAERCNRSSRLQRAGCVGMGK